MDTKKNLLDEQLDEVTGGVLKPDQKGEKKSLIRAIYDAGSALEIGKEREITKIEKDISEFFHKK